ncbi:MAG TPA: sigma-70 family RNA polymerase sigma factor [Burkholderiaceae bacterium]|nr:sigma-70 family RNA polymerase sigma factor [Burkholderiaceae bacterium]
MLHRQKSPTGQNADAIPAAPQVQGVERDEVRLVSRIAAGELRAFEELYRIYYPRLTRFLDRVIRRPGIVEEVLNDTMLVVWLRADGYNGSCKVSTWIFAIAYRKALKALQRFDEPLAEDESQAADDGPGPEEQAGRWQLREALTKALDGLSAEHRAVVDLTYFHGLGCREIADIVGCPVDTVKTRMFHARRKLKTLLTGTPEDWL